MIVYCIIGEEKCILMCNVDVCLLICFGLKSIVKVLVLFVIYVYVCTAIIYSSLCDR